MMLRAVANGLVLNLTYDGLTTDIYGLTTDI
jgi:hypothetical protein